MNILITGAGKGLGLALVKKFSEQPGNKIFAVSRNIEAVNNYLASGPKEMMSFSEVIPYSFDLTKVNYQELFDFVSMNASHLNILINNAGYLVNKAFLDIDIAEFDRSFDTNIKAAFRAIQCLYPLFDKNSHIVNITSMSGFQGSLKFAGMSVYSASKAALTALTECLAVEFDRERVSVNALAIGAMQTEMFAAAFPGYQAPLTADQVADFVSDFAENGHKYFNGKVLPLAVSTP